MAKSNKEILLGLMNAQFCPVFKGPTKAEWQEALIVQALKDMEPNLRSLHELGQGTVLSVAAKLASGTVIDSITAYKIAPELVKIVLDDIKRGT